MDRVYEIKCSPGSEQHCASLGPESVRLWSFPYILFLFPCLMEPDSQNHCAKYRLSQAICSCLPGKLSCERNMLLCFFFFLHYNIAFKKCNKVSLFFHLISLIHVMQSSKNFIWTLYNLIIKTVEIGGYF